MPKKSKNKIPKPSRPLNLQQMREALARLNIEVAGFKEYQDMVLQALQNRPDAGALSDKIHLADINRRVQNTMMEMKLAMAVTELFCRFLLAELEEVTGKDYNFESIMSELAGQASVVLAMRPQQSEESSDEKSDGDVADNVQSGD